MRVGICADIHLGNHKRWGGPVISGLNSRAHLVLDSLSAALRTARTEHCVRFLIAGDLVDYISVEPQMVRALQKVLADEEMPVYIMRGNHDMVSDADDDHALGPLAALSNVTIVERPHVYALDDGAELVIVPFQPGDARVWLPVELEKIGARNGSTKLLALHLGLIDDLTPAFLRDSHDAIPIPQLSPLLNKYGYGTAVAGNWHKYRKWQTRAGAHIVQIGALAPTGFDNPGLTGYGSLLIYDTQKPACLPERHVIPGPRFVAVRSQEGIDEAIEGAAACDSLFIRWDIGPELSLKACREHVTGMVEQEILAGADVVFDMGDAAAGAREGASAVAAASTNTGGDDVLAAYVDSISLPEGIMRESVLAESRRVLTAARSGR